MAVIASQFGRSTLRKKIEIPQSGTKHSLNVSVCGGMVLWEAFKAMRGGNRGGAEKG